MTRALLAAVPLIAVILASPAHAQPNSQQSKWETDVKAHGGPANGMWNPQAGKTLGDAVCAELGTGKTAPTVVTEVSNQGHLPTAQSQVIVYWAITDLCPNQMSQRVDAWQSA